MTPSPVCLHPLSRSPEESCAHGLMICVMVMMPPQSHIPENPPCALRGQEVSWAGLDPTLQLLLPPRPSSLCSSLVVLAELVARVRHAPEIALHCNLLISFVPWVLQVNVHVLHKQWFVSFWTLLPSRFDMIQGHKVVGLDVASHDKILVHPSDQLKTEHVGVQYLCLLNPE